MSSRCCTMTSSMTTQRFQRHAARQWPGLRNVVRTMLALTLLTTALPVRAQSVSELSAKLAAASAESTLDAADLAPWHLRLQVDLLAADGQKPAAGTIEMWWQKPHFYRVQYAFPEYTATFLKKGSNSYSTPGQGSAPVVLMEALNQVVNPVTVSEAEKSEQPQVRRKQFGNSKLDCIMLSKPFKPNADSHIHLPEQVPLGLFPTYCFAQDSPALRVSFSLGSQAIVNNSIGLFQKKNVATSSSLYENGQIVANSRILLLRSGEATPETLLDPSPDLVLVPPASDVPGEKVAMTVLHKKPPVYPQSAKLNHISGSVEIKVVIDRNGKVQHLRLLSAPDGDLALAALAAVRTWTYKPYLVDGAPVDVISNVTVKFEIR